MLALVSLVLFANVANSFVVRMPAMHQTTSLQQQRRHVGHQLSMISAPHGGKLVNTMVKEVSKQNELISSCDMEVDLDERQICDVELLMQGGFSPLEGYMEEADYKSVVNEHRLKNGILFGLPVVFDTNDESIVPGKRLLLKYQRIPIAVMDVSSKYLPNKADEAKKCYGTSSIEHPAVMMITTERGKYYCGGKITGLNRPIREFPCKSPEEVRAGLPTDVDVVAFQCRNPIHRAHYELFTRALDDPLVKKNSVVLVHPTCGPTQPDDIPGIVRYKTYEVLKEQTKNPRVFWSYLPYSMHMAGPREAMQHMIIRKNFGCTHFIIGRDMAGCKSSLDGNDFYGAYDAQDFAKKHGPELGILPVPSLNLVFTQEESYVTAEYAKEKGLTIKNLSGTKFRQMLRAGDEIPNWFAFESVVKVLREEAQAAPA